MTQAKTENSTSRRALFSGAGAVTALALLPTGASATPHPDAELIELSACFARKLDEYARACDESGHNEMSLSHPDWWKLNDALGVYADAAYDLLPIIAETEAKTLDGMRAKARAFHSYHSFLGTTPDAQGPEEGVVWSLICDLVGRAI